MQKILEIFEDFAVFLFVLFFVSLFCFVWFLFFFLLLLLFFFGEGGGLGEELD